MFDSIFQKFALDLHGKKWIPYDLDDEGITLACRGQTKTMLVAEFVLKLLTQVGLTTQQRRMIVLCFQGKFSFTDFRRT